MFAAHALDVAERLRSNELAICCRALARCSRVRRRPRARWRTRLVAERQPALLPHDAARAGARLRARPGGRGPVAAGAARAPPAPGRRGARRCGRASKASDGVLSVLARLRALGGRCRRARWWSSCAGPRGRTARARARARERGAERPCDGRTAGCAVPRDVGAGGRTPTASRRSTTFGCCDARRRARAIVRRRPRRLSRASRSGSGPELDVEQEGSTCASTACRVFARGAVWTPLDPVGHGPVGGALRAATRTVRATPA